MPTTFDDVVAEKTIAGRRFHAGDAPPARMADGAPLRCRTISRRRFRPRSGSSIAGRYQFVLDLTANERFVDGVFDLNRCRLIFKVDGRERLRANISRQDGRAYHDVIDQEWQAGDHQLAIEVQPLTPGEKQVRSLSIRINR